MTRLAASICFSAALAGAAMFGAPSTAQAQTLKDLLDKRLEQRKSAQPEQREDAAAGEKKQEKKLSPEEALEQAFENLRSEEEAVWKAAERTVTKSWSRSGSASMDLLLQRGRDAMRRENWDAAIEHLTDLVNLAPDFAEGWSARATVYFRQEKLGLALADLGEAIAQDPRHFGAYAGLGLVFEKLEDAPRATEAYRRSLSIHPNLKAARDGVERLSGQAEGRPV